MAMPALTPGEIDLMRLTAESSFHDSGYREVYTLGSVDAYGKRLETLEPEPPIACGFDGGKHREVNDGSQVVIGDGRLRLPRETVITPRDRFVITHRYGRRLLEPIKLRIIGEPERGPSAIVCNVALVNDGS